MCLLVGLVGANVLTELKFGRNGACSRLSVGRVVVLPRGRRAGRGVRRWVASCDAVVVDIIRLSEAPGYDSNRLVAEPLIEGSQSNVRVIRLSPGQTLPPHRHGSSDLMLFAVEGEGVLETDRGPVAFGAGSLAFYRGDEELRVSNEGRTGLTLLAFLAPPFPPRSEA